MWCRKNLLSAVARNNKIGVEKKLAILLKLQNFKKSIWCRKNLLSAIARNNYVVCGVEKTCYMLQLGRIELVQNKLAICCSLGELNWCRKNLLSIWACWQSGFWGVLPAEGLRRRPRLAAASGRCSAWLCRPLVLTYSVQQS